MSPLLAYLLPDSGKEQRGAGLVGLRCPPGTPFVPAALVRALKAGVLPWAACSASFGVQVGELCDKREGESGPKGPE